ncbi:MAG: DMT family transporter [Sulfurospirillaceae bacterium]|nr:DMT family transporter [Sulfurospirillaceae bacterium]MDD3463577.1 DMT family transporter [Sulfurospirillaceae bacterium]
MSTQNRGLLITSVGVFLMSFESLLIKMANVSAFNVAFYFGLFMFASATVLFFLRDKKNVLTHYKKHFKIIISSGFLMGLSNLFFILAIKNTTVANTVFILSCAPLFGALIGFIFLGQKTPKRVFIATFFVLAGLFIIVGNDLDSARFLGNFYALLCVISFSSLFVVLGNYKETSRVACVGVGGLSVALLAFICSPIDILDGYALGILLLMGGLISPISRILIGEGTKILLPAEIGLLTILETILAPIWVWIFLQEVPTAYTVVGGGVILLTLTINALYANKNY